MSYTHLVQYSTRNKYWKNSNIAVTGLILHSVGCAQPRAAVFANNFDSPNVSASIHGVIEPGTFIEMMPCWQTKGVAKKCCHVGSGSKGSYNSSRIGIEMTEPSTIKYTGGASFKDLNPAATADFVRKVTQTAVEVFADLCLFHGLKVEQIQTHAGAHREGMGSDHTDPEHLWALIGYDLNQFRKDVKARMATKTTAATEAETFEKDSVLIYKTFDSVPSWAQPTIKKLIDKKALQGTDKTINGKPCYDLSEDLVRTMVILDRLNKL